MSEASSYPDDETMKKSSLERSLRLLAWTQRFGLGTLWRVGENLWGSLLPKDGPNAYVQRRDRHDHPGMCVSASNDAIHATVPMWYGTHNKSWRCFSVHLDGPESAPTYFGHFCAVAIDRELFVNRDYFAKDRCAQSKYEKNHVVRYEPKSRLTDSELADLKRFIKENVMLVGVLA